MKKHITKALILTLFLVLSCNKEKTIDCIITYPHNEQEFYTDEDIKVNVTVDDKNGAIQCVHLYIDNKCYYGISSAPYEFTVKAGDILQGEHTIKVIAQNMEDIKGEAQKTIKVKEAYYESPDSVSFSDGLIPIGWASTGWIITPISGHLDSYSLFTRANNAYVTTTKTCNYIEFYLRGLGNINLYIDEILWDKIYMRGDWSLPQYWEKYMYVLPDGFHSFKWEFISVNQGNPFAELDDILFNFVTK